MKKWNILMFRPECPFDALFAHCIVQSVRGVRFSLLLPDWTCFWGCQGRGLILGILLPLMCCFPFFSSTVLNMVLLVVWSADWVTRFRLSNCDVFSAPHLTYYSNSHHLPYFLLPLMFLSLLFDCRLFFCHGILSVWIYNA